MEPRRRYWCRWVSSVGPYELLVLDLLVDAGAQPVRSGELALEFDPALLEVVDAAGSAAGAMGLGLVRYLERSNAFHTGLPLVTGRSGARIVGRGRDPEQIYLPVVLR